MSLLLTIKELKRTLFCSVKKIQGVVPPYKMYDNKSKYHPDEISWLLTLQFVYEQIWGLTGPQGIVVHCRGLFTILHVSRCPLEGDRCMAILF